ncbi:RHS repeat-associated core domain-containing protein [Microbulbifer epialgicus]|uniref:RHS repeat-associated core domain-containing protein n=1 Tax=Microbulbifer epialgicus TaxID=393907 RepID=A0ABV4NXF4_9GAMM
MQFFTGDSAQGLAAKLWEKNGRLLTSLCLGITVSLCTLFAAPDALAKPGISSDGAAPRAVSSANREDLEDMRVKVLGGDVRMTRRWTHNGWEWNSRWNPIIDYSQFKPTISLGDRGALNAFETEAKMGALQNFGKGTFRAGSGGGAGRFGLAARQGKVTLGCKQPYEYYIFRNGQAYRPEKFRSDVLNCISPDGDNYHTQLSQTISKDGDDYTWRDRKGNLIFYKEGKLKYYEDKNNVRVTLEYNDDRVKAVKDHHGNTVISYHWQEYTEWVNGLKVSKYLLKKLEDYTGRTVTYHYGEDSGDALNYRQLIAVTDMRGHNWSYQYRTLSSGERTLQSMTDPNGRVTTYSTNADGHINGYDNADGAGISYSHSYDNQSKTYKFTQRDNSGVVTETWNNAAGMPVKKLISGELQYQIEYQYSNNKTADDFAEQYRYAGGTQLIADVNAAPIRIISSTTTDARGLETKRYYDTFRNITRTEYADGSYTTTEWNTELTLPLKKRDERGVITEYGYDDKGNRLSLTEALGTPDQRTTRYTYDQYGQLKSETTGESTADNTVLATTSWEYDNYGNITKVTGPDEQVTAYKDYDANGHAHTVLDARLKTWSRDFDAVGNLLSGLNPYGQGKLYEYDDAGDLVKVTDASGTSLNITNNASGLPLTATDNTGNQLKLDYDKGDRLAIITDAEGASTGLEYDSQNRLRAITDGEQNRTTFTYQQNLLSKIEYPTYAEELGYDKRDRIGHSKQKANNQEYLRSYGYDLGSNLRSDIDALKNTDKYDYDHLSRLVAIIDPVNGGDKKTEFTYDARDNLLEVKDPEGRLTVYTYDKNDRLKTETRHDFIGTNKQLFYSYDGNGNLTEVTNPQQEKRVFGYDNANRLARLEVFASKANAHPVKVVDYYYNNKAQYTGYLQYPGTDNANVTADIVRHGETYRYDSLNRLESVKVDYYDEGEQSESVAFSKSYSYSYYGNGQKKTYTSPEGITYTYFYNKNNQLAAVHIPGEGQLAWTDFHWLAPQTLLLPGGNRITLSYDDFLRVKDRVLIDSAGNDKARAVYEYDLENNIRRITSEHGEYTFDYDNLYRLTEADYPLENSANDERFTYDGVGNRTSHGHRADGNTGNDFDASKSQSSYNNHNQLEAISGDNSASFKYNDNGHTIQKVQGGVTWDYHYNHEERLIAVDKDQLTVGKYQYNPYGQRIYKEAESATYFLYNEEGMVAEYDSVGDLIKEYHFKPGKPWMTEPLFQRLTTGEVFYYQNDHLGTPQRMLDKTGVVVWEGHYTVFGEVKILSAITENNFRFPGQYYDVESELYYNLFRYFDYKVARYLSRDRIGLRGGLNPYGYSLQNPFRFYDPEGKLALAVPAAFIALAAAVVCVAVNCGEGLADFLNEAIGDSSDDYDFPYSDEDDFEIPDFDKDLDKYWEDNDLPNPDKVYDKDEDEEKVEEGEILNKCIMECLDELDDGNFDRCVRECRDRENAKRC